jgi:hypothetical protein
MIRPLPGCPSSSDRPALRTPEAEVERTSIGAGFCSALSLRDCAGLAMFVLC